MTAVHRSTVNNDNNKNVNNIIICTTTVYGFIDGTVIMLSSPSLRRVSYFLHIFFYYFLIFTEKNFLSIGCYIRNVHKFSFLIF